MNLDLDPAALARAIAWGGLGLGVVLGAAAQVSRFCVRGAIADWMADRAPGRLVSWLLAIGVGAIGVQALIAGGLLDASRIVMLGDRLLWLSCLVGGLLFGYGMVLGGGCPQRCLVRAGAGNLRSLVVLGVIGITAAMTLRGLFAAPRVEWLDRFGVALGQPQDLGTLLGGLAGVSPQGLRWVLAVALLAGVLALAWRLRAGVARSHWIGGIVVGLVLTGAFFLTGHVGFLAEHPETLEPAWLGTQSRRPEGLSFSAPMAHTLDLLMLWSDKSMVATFGVLLALGTALGSFAMAKTRGEFRLEGFTSPQELVRNVAGGALMGFGGVTALGCSVGNGVTGLAALSLGSMLAVAGICAGAWLALRRQQRAAPAAAARPAAGDCAPA